MKLRASNISFPTSLLQEFPWRQFSTLPTLKEHEALAQRKPQYTIIINTPSLM
jgi:hypothetical protein